MKRRSFLRTLVAAVALSPLLARMREPVDDTFVVKRGDGIITCTITVTPGEWQQGPKFTYQWKSYSFPDELIPLA